MIDEEFSAEAFERAGIDSSAARELADRLAEEIQGEIDVLATAALVRIVGRLNDLGHDLQLYYPPRPGDIGYRDIRDGRDRLRVGYDSVISTGYAHVVDSLEELDDDD